jgi:uroporphyrinogen decarboxylase
MKYYRRREDPYVMASYFLISLYYKMKGSSMGLSSYKRTMKALNHQEPDRVPLALGGSAQKIDEPIFIQLLDHFGIREEKREYVFAGFRFTYYCEDLWKELGIDTRYIYVHPEKSFTVESQTQGQKYNNEWGLDMDFSRGSFSDSLTLQKAPLRHADLYDIKKYPWPRPDPKVLTSGLLERAKKYCSDEYPVMAYRPIAMGIFDMAQALRGTDQFLIDLILNRKLADTLLDIITETQKLYYRAVLDAVDGYIQVIEIEDDLGTQEAAMISPKMYHDIIKPRHAELIGYIKSLKPDIKVMMHSDGSIASLLEGIIEAGVDILNPIQTSAQGMEPAELKRNFGEHLVFQGGIDTQQVLRGRPQEVENEVKRVIDALAPGGGYLFGPAHNITRDIPMENVLIMYKTALKYGIYS